MIRLVADFDNSYSWLLLFAAGFADANGIYDWNYVVKEEVREKWRRIAAIGGNSPAGLVMQEVVDEMEAASWKWSEENDIQMFIFDRIGSKIKEVRKQNE